MAEYNPSKIIKDGNTYNFRDTTKIPLAGSNEISGSLIPSTDGTVNLGSPSYQLNNAYIKSLTINGVAAGDILTHNANEFVSVTGAQTIGGVKTFSDIPIVVNGKTYVSKINASRASGTQTGFSAYNGFKIVCNNDSQGWDNTAFAIHMPEYSPTRATVSFKLFDCIEGSSSYRGFGFTKGGDDLYLFPTAANTINLGSPSSQWNTTYTRNILIDNDINISSSLINKTSNSGVLTMRGGISDTEGASISLYGKDYGGSPGLIGNIYMTAYGNSDYTNFRIYPNGIIRVYNNSTATTKNVAMQEDVIPRSGGAVMTGSLLASSTTNSIGFGYGWGSGGTIHTYNSTHSMEARQGAIRLQPFKTDSFFTTMDMLSDGTWTWSGQAVQLVSDQRLKQQITEIDDKLLDAWEDVELVQFKYNESVNTKGKSARLHTGYVVQQIDSACKSHGIDISEYGLYCHEEYPEETKEVEVEQADGTKVKETKVIREASEHYSLRYTEIYAVECMYLRRCIKQLTARIEELEKGNNSK